MYVCACVHVRVVCVCVCVCACCVVLFCVCVCVRAWVRASVYLLAVLYFSDLEIPRIIITSINFGEQR